MTQLVRFHNWIVDKEQIKFVEIQPLEGPVINDYEKKKHAVVVHLNTDKCFRLICDDRYDAQRELDVLTAEVNPIQLTKSYNHYIVNQIYHTRRCMNDLSAEIKKLMKSYAKLKKKETT